MGKNIEKIEKDTANLYSDCFSRLNDWDDITWLKQGEMLYTNFALTPEKVQGKKCLDGGCGHGTFSYQLLKNGASEVYGVDLHKTLKAGMFDKYENMNFVQASLLNMPFPDNSFDLVFSIGVLHHIPDTKTAMRKCVEKVKPGGYLLVYLYYNFENRGLLFRLIFHASNLVRRIVSSLPTFWKKIVCDLFAVMLYLPLAALSKVLSALCLERAVKHIPLSYYADTCMNIIRNDSLDRFGTPLEKRFSRDQIRQMMTACGLHNIVFSEKEPYWHAIGQKK